MVEPTALPPATAASSPPAEPPPVLASVTEEVLIAEPVSIETHAGVPVAPVPEATGAAPEPPAPPARGPRPSTENQRRRPVRVRTMASPVAPTWSMDYAHNPPTRGFRQGVAAVVLDGQRRVLVCERLNPAGSWQFVQGGMSTGEHEEHALIRELGEEIGVLPHDVQIIACVLPRYRYTLRRTPRYGGTMGQEHRYYVVQVRPGCRIDLGAFHKPEFRQAKFVTAAEFPFDSVFIKKRKIYWDVLHALEPLVGPLAVVRPLDLEDVRSPDAAEARSLDEEQAEGVAAEALTAEPPAGEPAVPAGGDSDSSPASPADEVMTDAEGEDEG
jgi:putative (di)nucleoside polyphosphate hydrolase